MQDVCKPLLLLSPDVGINNQKEPSNICNSTVWLFLLRFIDKSTIHENGKFTYTCKPFITDNESCLFNNDISDDKIIVTCDLTWNKSAAGSKHAAIDVLLPYIRKILHTHTKTDVVRSTLVLIPST